MVKNISLWWKILFCTAAIAVGFLTVGNDRYVAYIKEKAIGISRAQGIPIALYDVHGGFNWLHAKKAEVLVYTNLSAIPLELADLELHVPYGSLISAPAISVQGTLYEGSLKLNATSNYNGDKQTCTGEIKDSKISLHPQLKFLGFVGGLFSIEFDNLEVLDRKPHKGNVRFNLQNMKHPDKMELPPFLTGLPLTIRIPSFSIDSFVGDLSLENETIASREFTLKSSMGSVEGKELVVKGPQELEGYFDINLTDDGIGFIGPLLPLLSNKKLTETSRNFALSFNGSPQNPKWIPR